MARITAIVALLACSGVAVAFPPHVRAVRQGAPPGGNGLTWATAYNDLQLALDAAAAAPGQITELWVTAGTYVPTRRIDPGDPSTVCFSLLSGVQIYGGFAGTETDRPQRNPAANISILDDGSPPVTNIVRAQGVDASAVLDGFRISGAYPSNAQAGGILILSASPTIRQCTITQNASGVVVNGGSPRFHDCIITANATVVGTSGIRITSGTPLFEDCSVTAHNVQLFGGAGVSGEGGRFRRVMFSGNSAPDSGGGAAEVSLSTFEGCRFLNNSAIGGSAVWGNDNTFVSCAFTGNVSAGTQGAVHGMVNTFLNCTFRSNRADLQQGGTGAGGITGGIHTIANSILWGNCAPAGNCSSAATQIAGFATSCTYTTIQGWSGTPAGAGNNATDPQFADAQGRLASSSPSIDAGNGLLFFTRPFFDADNRFRFAEGPAPNTGLGPAPQIDRGAYEYGAQPFCYANINQSTDLPILNVADFADFLQLYAAGHPLANCDGSTTAPVLNVADFTCFLQRYAAGCG